MLRNNMSYYTRSFVERVTAVNGRRDYAFFDEEFAQSHPILVDFRYAHIHQSLAIFLREPLSQEHYLDLHQ